MTYIAVETISRKTKPRNLEAWICCFGIVILIALTVISDFSRLLDSKHMLHVTENKMLDYNKLMNISFNFLRAPLVCNDSSLFIVMVHTSPENFEKRKAIRETWGNKETQVKVLFAIGTIASKDDKVKRKLDEEMKHNDDFVQGSFRDSYHNLTYKHVMLLKYFFYHCSKVDYLVKVDDDVFINMPSLKIFLSLYNHEFKNETNIICSKMYGNPVLRYGNWGVPVKEYPDKFYPGHCSGFAIMYPRATVSRLYVEAQRTEYFWIDDVYVSGILAKKAAITHTGLNNLLLTSPEVDEVVQISASNITRPFLLGRMNLRPDQVRALWKFVLAHNPKVSILDYLAHK